MESRKCYVSVINLNLAVCIILTVHSVFTQRVIKIHLPSSLQEVAKTRIKHILLWNTPNKYKFNTFETGQKSFIEARCPIDTCYFTSNKEDLKNYTQFDAILFNGPELHRNISYPTLRHHSQIYTFVSTESAENYIICDPQTEDLFNWTWTYKLDSDIPWPYITVRDLDGRIVAPSIHTTWINNKHTIKKEIFKKFSLRTKAAIWIVSHCQTHSRRENYVKDLNKELLKYELKIEIYGKCGAPAACDTSMQEICDHHISRDYYFYMALENSLSEDYVTEKVMHGYKNYVVPIVYGGANYSRFLPPNSYINMRDMNVTKLAALMKRAMKESKFYEEYFQWTNHYTIELSSDKPDSNHFCRLCKSLHYPVGVSKGNDYKRFREWWNGGLYKGFVEKHDLSYSKERIC